MTETADAQVLFVADRNYALVTTRKLPGEANDSLLFTDSTGTQYYAIIQTDNGQFGLFTDKLQSSGE
jgi:hypothetical protein